MSNIQDQVKKAKREIEKANEERQDARQKISHLQKMLTEKREKDVHSQDQVQSQIDELNQELIQRER